MSRGTRPTRFPAGGSSVIRVADTSSSADRTPSPPSSLRSCATHSSRPTHARLAAPHGAVAAMYVPQHFAESDPTTLAAFIDAHPFGTLVTSVEGVPFASHVPFIYDRAAGLLHCHLARGNPQWRHFESSPEALAIFAGPHSYISPTWYTDAGVPTWNYA